MSFPFNLIDRLFRPQGKRQIEAGGGGRRWTGSPLIAAPQQSVLTARGPSKARATALSLNNPTANAVVETHVSELVGAGWQASSRHPDPDTRRDLNRAFEEVMTRVLTLAARALVRDGESFLRTVWTADGEFRVLVLPADQIDPTLTRDLGNGARIIAGIEFDADERVTAYHVLPDAPGTPFGMIGAAVRVPARDMLHVFDPLVPGQVRGLSWLAPILLKLADYDASSDAMLMSLKVQSMMTAFIKSVDGTATGFEGTSDNGNVNVSLEPGMTRILPPGTEVTFSQPGQGLSQAVEFLKAQLREIAAGAGLTYEQVSADLSDTNYSSARVGLLQQRRRAEMLQRTVIEARLLRPLWRRWIDGKALAGEIPADEATLALFRDVKFVAPGWQWIDPLKEVNGDVAAIAAGLKSRAEVVASRGRDIEELDEEIAADARTAQGAAQTGATP
jgi:lambda family phage portal protein